MAKHFGEASLIQLLTLVKEKIDTLLNKIEEKQQPFIITATADFANMVLTNVSCTFAEITAAYERGDHIFLNLDISQTISGQRALIALVSFHPDKYAVFEQIVSMDGSFHITGILFPDGTSNFEFIPLASQTQIGGLTFKVSDTVPTVDDRSVITFVVEE